MSQIIVQKLNGLQVLGPLLRTNKVNLQRNVVALVGHLTKNPNLHSAIGKRQTKLCCFIKHLFISILDIFSSFEKKCPLLTLNMKTGQNLRWKNM